MGLIMKAEWTVDNVLDDQTWESPKGKYACVRTFLDVSILFFRGRELRRDNSGSHTANKEFAENHFEEQTVCHKSIYADP